MKGLKKAVLNNEELEAVSGGRTGQIKVNINPVAAKKKSGWNRKLFGTANTQQEQLMKVACPGCGEVLEVMNINTVTSVTCSNPSCGCVFEING